ncbi:conserved hypothetical protein [Tenacibaculum maritimum]|nr:hypothetical protein [Tenacibaculum maritimum]CAA0181052.1 conserved hypothetical protein [Tenacibaculum maritimum]
MPYFIPLGIPDFKGKKDRDFIQVSYLIEGNDAVELTIQIRDGGKIIYQEKITDSSKLTKGEHCWKWNGFDSNGIYDSAVFTTAKDLNIYTIAIDNEENYSRKRVEFTAKYSEVKWVDVKINKNTKRIDVTLRVNLKDGGEIGTEKDCIQVGSSQYSSIKTVCPWEKIPEKEIDPKDPILKARNESNNFDALKQLAMDGIEKYWERNNTNIGKGVYIDEELYEVFISCKQGEQGMVAPKIIYFTNSENTTFNRSHNWFASRKLYYKEGYLKNERWVYRNSSDAIQDFKETAAHEIGHELLAKLNGKYHSYTHKGTSHPSVIIQDPIEGTKYPTGGEEIDLMKYADDFYPYDYYKRVILSEKDLLGLLWLTKLELK